MASALCVKIKLIKEGLFFYLIFIFYLKDEKTYLTKKKNFEDGIKEDKKNLQKDADNIKKDWEKIGFF